MKKLRTMSPKMRPTVVGAAIVVLLGGALASCTGRDLERFRDAPVESRDDNGAVVVNMPDGYGNVAIKCVELNDNWVVVTSTFTADGTAGRGVSVVDGSGICSGE